ncbi:ATP-binding protein [Haloarchaeobius amylolyticus]|uniref:ATP-binding protein n=1 Tax=Haloarchaeobius amylolyticus TaxID=1198296 RepID=UPI00226EB83F|nr:ATP-binding protein [Haloarchaeobius amylolyticus]
MPDAPPVVVTARTAERRSAVATALDVRPTETVAPEALGEWLATTAAACLVVADDPADPVVRDACEAGTGVPTVVFAAVEPGSVPCHADGFVRDDGRYDRLRDEVRWRLRAGTDAAESELEASRAKIERLHTVAAEMVACDTEAEVFEVAIRAAEQILDLDIVGIDTVEDGYFVPRAVSEELKSSGYGTLPADEGVAGRSYQEGESILVPDTEAHPDASPTGPYRSVLSVPIGDIGILQAGSCETDAFGERDRELAELLVSHVAETVERLQAEERLRRERDRLSALFENVPDPVVRFAYEDGALRVQDVNATFERVFGWAADEIRGEDIDEYIVPEGREDEAKRLNEKLMAGESLHVTTQRRTHDEVRDILLHVVPFERGERSLQGFAIYTDITEEKARQRELERQNERLDAFASIVSHDLRNPLSIAQGYLTLAQDVGDPEHFEEIRHAHERMSNLIDDLLTLSRQGDVVGSLDPVSLAEVATQAWAGVQTGGAELAVVEDTTLLADRDRLVELFENLFRNAVLHGCPVDGDAGYREDGSSLTVTVGVLPGEPAEDAAGFYVADSGCGIPPGERETVFESGYTTSDEGTGFGLTIVQEIASAHGWAVSVDESEAGGVQFDFEGVETPADET